MDKTTCKIKFKFTIPGTRITFANELFFFLIYIFKIGVRIRFDGALDLREYAIF